MKHLRIRLVRVGIALFIIAIVLAIAAAWFVRRSWPQVSGTLAVPGLAAPVSVIRDKWGVPHIYAQNERDLLMAQGYVHAQDRLWQMEVSRRFGNGTLSEILGESAVDLDRYARTLGLRRVAAQSWAAADDDTRAVLESYAAGVNAYIQSQRGRLPVEFTLLGFDPEPWAPVDSITWGNVLALQMGLNYQAELARSQFAARLGEKAGQDLFPFSARNVPFIIPPETQGRVGLRNIRSKELAAVQEWLGNYSTLSWGSNNWVVHGSRTATGKPLLANDTHVNLQMPSVWYENDLHGGRFNSAGFTVPGVPLVLIGHNQRIAWGITNLDPDVQDLYLEKLDDVANPTQYEFMNQWYSLSVIQETIKVKGAAPVKLDIRLTRHGPIVNDAFGLKEAAPMAIRWHLYEGTTTFKSIVLLNLAANWDEFRASLRSWDTLDQNFVYADVEGNIGYQAAGRVPIRAPGHQGTLPVPGWTGEYEWQGYIPFDMLPAVLNPPAGFVATANNRVVDDYPYQLCAEWWPGYRAKRINDLLASTTQVTLADMRAIQTDTYSLPAETLRPYLLALKPKNTLQAEALAQVKAWDLRNETDRTGASIYEAWFRFLARNTLGDELRKADPALADEYLYSNPEKYVIVLSEIMADAHNAWFDDVNTPEKETRDDIALRSLDDAVNWLGRQYGTDPRKWQWGRMHVMAFAHMPFGQSGIAPLESLFNSRTVAVPGGQFSVNQAWYPEGNLPFQVIHGTAQRMIVDLGDWDRSLAVNSTGQSEQIFHPHRQDQISMWQSGEYYSMLFTQQAVKANAESVLILAPR